MILQLPIYNNTAISPNSTEVTTLELLTITKHLLLMKTTLDDFSQVS